MRLPTRRLAVAAAVSALSYLAPSVPPADPSLPPVDAPLTEQRDVVVYGGTPAGVAAAIAAAGQGADVTLLAEGSTVGGMMSNGISAADIGSPLAVQGLAQEFFDRIRAHYRDPDTWRFEPKVAEPILATMLSEAGVEVRYRSPLRYARLAGRAVSCVEVADRHTFCARNFVDASYTGDLVAAARVPHRLGLSDLLSYGESLASVRRWIQILQVPVGSEATARTAFEDNPFVRVEPALPPYESVFGRGAPSLAYRLCVTAEPGNRTPFRPAADYARYLPSFQIMAARFGDRIERKSNGTLYSDAFHLARIPGEKYDLNAGYMSLTNLPAPAGYFSDLATRRAHNATLRAYVESFFHFVQTDPSVRPALRDAFAPFGLCADEYVDNGNWPREPYVREGRRIQGRATLTQQDVFVTRTKSDAVALGSYNVDGKLSQIVYAGGGLHRDRTVHSTAPTYELPYSVMVPEAGSVTNLLAPVGISASPTAYGSVRMEPQYMALGQAAGIAAALATRGDHGAAALPAARIQAVLRSEGVTYKARDVCLATPRIWRAPGGYSFFCRVLPVEPQEIL